MLKYLLILLTCSGCVSESLYAYDSFTFLEYYDSLDPYKGKAGHFFVRDAGNAKTGQHGDPTVEKGWAIYIWNTRADGLTAGWTKIADQQSLGSDQIAMNLYTNYVSKADFKNYQTTTATNFAGKTEITKIENNITTINSSVSSNTKNISTLSSQLLQIDANKQNVLISGTNIKTINGESIVGGGDIIIKGGTDTTPVVVDLDSLCDVYMDYDVHIKLTEGKVHYLETTNVFNYVQNFCFSMAENGQMYNCEVYFPLCNRDGETFQGTCLPLNIKFDNKYYSHFTWTGDNPGVIHSLPAKVKFTQSYDGVVNGYIEEFPVTENFEMKPSINYADVYVYAADDKTYIQCSRDGYLIYGNNCNQTVAVEFTVQLANGETKTYAVKDDLDSIGPSINWTGQLEIPYELEKSSIGYTYIDVLVRTENGVSETYSLSCKVN